MTPYWVLWFVITVISGQTAHFPVDDNYPDQAACEADLDHWYDLITEQFPDDPGVRVYCELYEPPAPSTKGLL